MHSNRHKSKEICVEDRKILNLVRWMHGAKHENHSKTAEMIAFSNEFLMYDNFVSKAFIFRGVLDCYFLYHGMI